jgi:hypothetical protein
VRDLRGNAEAIEEPEPVIRMHRHRRVRTQQPILRVKSQHTDLSASGSMSREQKGASNVTCASLSPVLQ